MATAFAPGKVILSGEHSVVYGHPAITMAVNLGVTATVEQFDGPSQLLTFPDDTLLWNAIQEVVPQDGFRVAFESTLPFGKGMGSSAALSIALIRAYHSEISKKFTGQEELQLGLQMERHFHGSPSGIDHSTSSMGTGILFRKGPPADIQPLTLPPLQLLIIDSGSKGSTKRMVDLVRKNQNQNSTTLDEIGQCTQDIVHALCQNELHTLGELFNHNHCLLRDLGISTPQLEDLRDRALEHGALGVKISGSGGGGILLALIEDSKSPIDHFTASGIATHLVKPYKPSEMTP
jgi:mevalonate kinase